MDSPQNRTELWTHKKDFSFVSAFLQVLEEGMCLFCASSDSLVFSDQMASEKLDLLNVKIVVC